MKKKKRYFCYDYLQNTLAPRTTVYTNTGRNISRFHSHKLLYTTMERISNGLIYFESIKRS